MENLDDEMANFCSAKSSCGKRKREVLLLKSKLVILDHLKAGVAQEKLANEYRIGCWTVGDIKKNEEMIRSFASLMECMTIRKKG